MSRILSPLQEAILLRVSHLERLQESRVRDYLGTYFRGLEESDKAWCEEFSLALELLVLYGHIRIQEDPRKGRILSLAPAAATPSVTDTPVIEAATPRWPAVSVAAMAVLAAAGCTLLPSSQPTAKAVAPLPVYSDGTGFPSRIEQFFNGRNMVYRYCQDDECPLPTPKVASAAQRFDAPRYETTADAHNAVAIGVAGASVAAAAQRLNMPRYETATDTRNAVAIGAAGASIAAAAARIGPLTEPQAKMNAKPTATLVAAASSGAVQSIGASVGATAPNMLATLSQKEWPTAGLALRTDGEFTSYKGMVGFQQGSMVLDGLSRQKVAELAPMARDAERVRLRGRVASSQLTEDMKKLAVGRAYAVKVEFGKHDVDKAKIRILNPQQANAENATGTVRGVDVMLDMPEKKSLSGMVKEGA